MDKFCITFDESAKLEILEAFDRTIDEKRYVVEKDNPHQRVRTQDGEEITIDDFAGIMKGSLVFIKKDLPSLIRVLDKFK
jgi:hypothetical protein